MIGGPWAPTMLRGFSAFVGLTEEVSAAASAMIKAGANATVILSNAALSISRAAGSLLGEAWDGIDLSNLTANATATRWYQNPSMPLQQLLRTSVGQDMMSLPKPFRDRLLRDLYSVSPDLPFRQQAFHHFCSDGDYAEYEFTVQLFASGHVGVQLFHGHVKFKAQWANPF